MNRLFVFLAVVITGMVSVQGQDASDTFVKTENQSMFSQCIGAQETTEFPPNDSTRKCINMELGACPHACCEENIDTETIEFQDESIKEFCLRNKLDTNNDGHISIEEALVVKELSLMCTRSFIRNIKSYGDLKFFPNLERFHAGFTYVDIVDVSCCPKLKELDLSDCRELKTIILAKGCKPEIKYPVAYKGKQAEIVYKQ